MTDNARGPMLPWLALLTIWIVWGSTYLGMKLAVETIPPFIMTSMRFYMAAPLMLLLSLPAWRNKQMRVTPVEIRNAAIIGVILLVGGTGLGAMAQRYLDSSFAALLVSLSPIWMSMFTSMHTRVSPDRKILGALVVGLIGIGIMVGGPGGDAVSFTGIALILASSLFWSFGTVQSRFAPMPKNAFVSSGIQMIAGGTALMVMAFFLGEFDEFAFDAISSKSWLAFWWLVVAGSLVAYTAYMYANQTLPIEIVSTYAYVNPIIAVVLGASIDGDPIGPNVLIGGTVILLAVVFIVSGHLTRRGPLRRMG